MDALRLAEILSEVAAAVSEAHLSRPPQQVGRSKVGKELAGVQLLPVEHAVGLAGGSLGGEEAIL